MKVLTDLNIKVFLTKFYVIDKTERNLFPLHLD